MTIQVRDANGVTREISTIDALLAIVATAAAQATANTALDTIHADLDTTLAGKLDDLLTAFGSLDVTVNASDIQIGAIELKDGATDNRAVVVNSDLLSDSTVYALAVRVVGLIQKLDILHADLATTLAAKLDAIHVDTGTTLHADIATTVAGKLDTLHADLATTIHTDLATTLAAKLDALVTALVNPLPVISQSAVPFAQTVTIANGANESSAITTGGTPVKLLVPASVEGTYFRFSMASTVNGTYSLICDDSNTPIQWTVGAGALDLTVLGGTFLGVAFMKISTVDGSAVAVNQSGAASLTLISIP